MKIYHSKFNKLAGTDYKEVYDKARGIYKEIYKKSKRKPYVRSVYFKKDKVFLDYFWQHLHQKNWWDQIRRLRFYACALDLLKNSHYEPISKENPNKAGEIMHRFAGATKDQELFFIQVAERRRTDQKFFISVFPIEDTNKIKKTSR